MFSAVRESMSLCVCLCVSTLLTQCLEKYSAYFHQTSIFGVFFGTRMNASILGVKRSYHTAVLLRTQRINVSVRPQHMRMTRVPTVV